MHLGQSLKMVALIEPCVLDPWALVEGKQLFNNYFKRFPGLFQLLKLIFVVLCLGEKPRLKRTLMDEGLAAFCVKLVDPQCLRPMRQNLSF